MILTLTNPTKEYAQAMSQALWKLARPSLDGTTQFAVGWVQNESGDYALALGDYVQRVDQNADIDAFIAVLPIPQDEKDALKVTLEAARGSSLSLIDNLPPTLAAQLVDESWLPDEEI